MNNYLFLQLNRNLGYDLFTNDMIEYIDDYIKIKEYYDKREGLYRLWYEQLWEESNWKNGEIIEAILFKKCHVKVEDK